MGSKWFTGGVSAAPRGRIQFDFKLEGIRYRPTLRRPPWDANLRLAREHLGSIKQQIAVGTFSFPNEFPDYRYLGRVVGTASIRSCNQVFDEFLAHCESRVSRNDMASVPSVHIGRCSMACGDPHWGNTCFIRCVTRI
jgi:hypothetical protein